MYIFCKTNNPRPTFHRDMTEHRATMQRHVAYWKKFAENGIGGALPSSVRMVVLSRPSGWVLLSFQSNPRVLTLGREIQPDSFLQQA